jgi:NAD(P)H-hydrate epimerase
MITGTEMGVVDENAEALGVPRKQLMESSGNAVAAEVREVGCAGVLSVNPGRRSAGATFVEAA